MPQLERIFASFREGGPPTGSAYDPTDPDTYDYFIQAMIRDSRDYEASVLAPKRDYATKLYYGLVPRLDGDTTGWSDTYYVEDPNATYEQILGSDDDSVNRSTYVSTDVRDAVMMMLPSLIRCFAANQEPVYLVPRGPQDEPKAAEGTKYVNYTFWNDNPGFLLLYGAFKDALTVKTGFIKWWTDDHRTIKRKTFTHISPMQLQMMIMEDQTARVYRQGRLDPRTGEYDTVTIQYEESKPIIRIAGVPPEEMRLDRFANTFRDSRITGHERIVPVDQLVAMGYDRDLCMDYIQGQSIAEFTMEAQIRNEGRYMSTRFGDGVLYGEWYVRIDKDGDGVPELRKICTMGNDYRIVDDEETNHVRFAMFSCDPIAHTIVGDSLADYTEDIQKFKTNMARGVLDSLAESITPKTVINELMVNVEDAMNDDLSAVIRTRGDPSNTVQFATVPFAGQQAMPIIEWMNEQLQRRTGLTDAAKGLDPKVLQSSTELGVQAIITGQQERTELVARVLAETGFRDVFTGLYNEVCENPNQRRTLKINGQWIPFDTSTFDAAMGVEVNPSLGKGNDIAKMMTLSQIKQDQQLVVQTYGLGNPICGVNEMLNTVEDMLELANFKNMGRYFQRPPPEVIQQMASAPKEPDAMTIAARAQMEKIRYEQAKAQGQHQIEVAKLQKEDDFRRDELRQKGIYEYNKLIVDRAQAGLDAHVEMGKMAQQMWSAQHEAGMNEAKFAHEKDMAEREFQQKQMELDSQERQAEITANGDGSASPSAS